ncbi:MAG: CBS domain-containing protein, partial [Thermoanaerobaculum sp.]|nr:CBS domain-containing protein [Thermoanaerobaculum sp.]MDW7967520.1 CBS domain-containing protein [Thermoanaerobaculum sp.]
ASLGERLLAANLALAVFNMLPAFPMDGGRVLRALLALGGDFLRATQVAAAIGQGMALLFAFFGLLTNPMLLFVALFVWIGAQQEATAVQMRNALSGIPVRRTMITDFRTLAPEDTLEKAVEYLLATSQQDFPVVREGQVVGVLTRGDLLRALSQRDEQVPVETVMQRDFTPVHPNEMLEAALARLEACQCHTFPVVEGGRLVGILTTENVGEYLMLVSAMERRKAQRRLGGEVAPA